MPTSLLKRLQITAVVAVCACARSPAPTPTPPVAVVDALAVLNNDEAAMRPWLRDRLLANAMLPSGTDPVSLRRTADGVIVVGRRGQSWLIHDNIVSTVDGLEDASPAGAAHLHRLERRIDVTFHDRLSSVTFEGALFALLVRADDDGVTLFVAGLEDAPLDRSGGSFGNIDSFLFRVRVDGDGVHRVWSRNLSEAGVVMPKALAFVGDDLVVVGAGNGTIAVVDDHSGGVRDVVDGLVGGTDLVVVGGRQLAVVSPIADAVAFIDLDTGARRLVPIVDPQSPRADDLARLGEVLVFSTALAPEQRSDGPLSRFTCEACHTDGGIDGRVHATGRFDDGAEVLASTRPLFGLFQNPPLFSRGIDKSVAVMVHAEVGVANANSPRSPWTPLVVDLEAPFVRDVVASVADVVDPLTQRRAMLRFFATFGVPRDPTPHDVHPGVARGQRLFAQHCQRCHQARVFTDDIDSVVDPALHPGAVVWASAEHFDVGVRPLVHPDGARPASLRGVRHKRPLLTNGAATDLVDLVGRLRIDGSWIKHDGDRSVGKRFDDDEAADLVSFLQTL